MERIAWRQVKLFTTFFLWLAAAVLTARPAAAQVLYGSLAGTVQDTTGAAVPGAIVSIVNDATGQTRQVVATDQGTYSFPDVLAGTYALTVEAKGFRTSRTTGVEVTINTVTRMDAQLGVGDRADTVTVAANAVVLQTDSADLHVSLGSKEVTQLPLPGYRNYQTLISLVPGATPASYQNAVSGSPGRSLNTNINGASNTNNNTRLDGALDMRASLRRRASMFPPPNPSRP